MASLPITDVQIIEDGRSKINKREYPIFLERTNHKTPKIEKIENM